MPFGLCTATATFQRLMANVLTSVMQSYVVAFHYIGSGVVEPRYSAGSGLRRVLPPIVFLVPTTYAVFPVVGG